MRAERLLVLPALFLALVAAGATGCGVPENETDNPTANWLQVSDGIYRGARPDRAALEKLAALHFKTILTLEDNAGVVAEETKNAEALGLHEVVAEMTGSQVPKSESIETALSTLADPANYPIYVHCKKGCDRTGCIIALHRVFNEGWDAKDARREMLDRGFDTSLLRMKDFLEKKIGLDE